MEPEVIDAQYGRGRRMYGELISRPVPATKTGQAYSRQRHTKRMKHSSRLPGIFVWRRRPFATSEGSAMSLPSLGSAMGSGVTCGSPWNRKGMVSRSVLSTNTKQASPESVHRHVNIPRSRTVVGSAMRFYRYIYSSVY